MIRSWNKDKVSRPVVRGANRSKTTIIFKKNKTITLQNKLFDPWLVQGQFYAGGKGSFTAGGGTV